MHLRLAILAGILVSATGHTQPLPTDTPSPAASITNRSPYTYRAEHSRDGIGKFYLGREIAHVMGHQAADWLERPEREAEEKTELMLKSLEFRPGESVGDIGAGTGYFTRRIARLVGTNGAVYAVEIQQEMLDLLTNSMAGLKIHNVKPILGTTRDPRLPANTLDRILLVDVYHEFDFPYEMTDRMVHALKPGGQLILVEYRGEDPAVPIKPLHKMTQAQVKKEMAAHPLEHLRTIDVLPWQHILIFQKRTNAPPR